MCSVISKYVPSSNNAYIEPHIEQEPVLENNQKIIGVVSSIQDLRQ